MLAPSPKDALIIVDVQMDFLPGGALGVADGDKIIPIVNRLEPLFSNIVLSRDWHPVNHISFAEEPKFVDKSWPPHCVQNTEGAAFHPDLTIPPDALIISKGTDPKREAYSAFQATDADLAGWLRGRGVERLFLAGLATDYCVRTTALDGRAAGFEVYVIDDAVRGISPDTIADAYRALEEAGVRRITSADLLGAETR